MNKVSLERVKSNMKLLEENNIKFIWKNKDNGHIEIQDNGATIHCWLTSGSFRNINTGKSGKGILNLIQYITWIRDNKGKTTQKSSESTVDNDFNIDLGDRVTLLEQRLESCLERISELEKLVFKHESQTKHNQ